MKKIMILGAGPFQVPAIKKAKEMGLMVIICSNRPDDPGIKVADIAYLISTTEKERLLEIAKREGIIGVMTMGTDVAVPSVAYIAEQLGLSGISLDVAMTVTDKGYFRDFLKANNLPSPKYGIAESVDTACDLLNSFHGDAIMKPVFSSGSRGIIPVKTDKDIINNYSACINASFGRKAVIVEEFLHGREIGGEALVFQSEIVFFQLTNKYTNPYFVPKGHSMPSDLPDKTQKQIRGLLEKIVKTLGIVSSPLNFDIMLTDYGPVVIEIGCRLGGNCLPELMNRSTGIDTILNVIRLAIGQTPILITSHPPECYGIMIVGCNHTGILKSITPKSKIRELFPEHIIGIEYHYSIGDKVSRFNQGANSIGIIMMKAKNCVEMDSIFQIIEKKLNISIKEG